MGVKWVDPVPDPVIYGPFEEVIILVALFWKLIDGFIKAGYVTDCRRHWAWKDH